MINERRSNRSPRSRGWCFTINNPDDSEIDGLGERANGDGISYCVFGYEFGENGTPHLQGYIHFVHPRTMVGVKKVCGHRAHLEIAVGNAKQNRDYCVKDGNYCEYGQCPVQGGRTDLANVKTQIISGKPERDIAMDNFSLWCQYRRSFSAFRELLYERRLRMELRVHAIIGDPGTGKSRFAWEFAERAGTHLWVTSDPSLKWFDGYGGQLFVCIDDFRGGCDYEFMLRLLDIYPLDVPIKGGFVCWQPTTIFITSNLEPQSWYCSNDYGPLKRRIHRVSRISDQGSNRWEDVNDFLTYEHSLINSD